MEPWGFQEGDELSPGRTALELLGGGRRYEAWLAFDEHRRVPVVVKLLRPELVGNAGALRALREEAALVGRLSHPMLLRSFGAVLDGERPQLVLEHIEGLRLSTTIRRFGVILEQLLPLALNLCAVLHYLARERVVHLDVKPSNIIMAERPKLIDLSVARTFEQLAQIDTPIGTTSYMAPEQCDPARFSEIGPASDIWGLGVTLYQALTRELPFPSGYGYPQLSMAPRPLPDGVPDRLACLVMACLEPRPDDRPAAGWLADELEPIVAALPAPKLGNFRPGGRRMLRELELG